MSNINARGYIRIHMGLFSNNIFFGRQEKAMTVGEGLLQFVYCDLDELRNRASYRAENFEIVHPYFVYCDHYFLSSFVKNLNSHEPDSSFPSIDELIRLQSKYRDILTTLYDLSSDFDTKKISRIISENESLKETAFYSLSSLSSDGKNNSYIDFFVPSFEDAICVEMIETIRRRVNLVKCRNCGRLFIPKRANSDYCQRIYTADGKTCAEIGYAQNFNRNVRNDELLMAYTKAYKAHYARMSKPRKRVRNMTREEFNSWYREAKDKLNQARAGLIDPDEYKAWLKK